MIRRLVRAMRRFVARWTQPVLPPDEQARFDAGRSSDGSGHGGLGPG